MQPTKEQERIINTNVTAVVAAGAGSGKTTVLAQRFVRLVLENKTPVEKILTLTFTKKATSEMFERIYRFLAQKKEEAEAEEQRLLDRALKDFYKARIETLDSYCASIVRPFAAKYGLSPDFAEDMERQTALVGDEAFSFVIKHRENAVFKAFYGTKSPEDIARDVFAGTIEKYCFLGAPVDFVKDFEQNEKIIAGEFEKNKALLKKAIETIECLQEQKAEEIKSKGKQLLQIPVINNLDARDEIIEAVRQTYKLAYSKLNEIPAKMFKDEINALRGIFETFAPLAVFILQKEWTRGLYELLNQFEEIVFARKRRDGVCSYSDVASLARNVLLEDKEARREEKEKFDYIIIDEFQDNNALQRDILFLLAEKKLKKESETIPEAADLIEGKLFFVGDEKQSIYKFRGADVSVFRGLQEIFPNGKFTLQTNFRSVHSLIGAFNAVFGGTIYSESAEALPADYEAVFLNKSENLPPYEALYVPLEVSEAKKNIDGKITVCVLKKDEQNENAAENEIGEELGDFENEAVFAAKKIKELVDSGKYKYKDIAILMKSHTNEYLFEKHLRRLGIPYSNENLSASISVDPVSDIYSLLHLISFPAEKFVYAQFLRSPFVDMTFNGMIAVMLAYEKIKIPFDADKIQLSDYDKNQFEKGREIYEDIKNHARNFTISGLINYIFYQKGYRYEILWHKETRVFSSVYNLLFSLAVKADKSGMGLSNFTVKLQKMINEKKSFFNMGSESWLDDLTVPEEKENTVSIMTIHKSKGLQFPVVFIPNCGSGKRGGFTGVYAWKTGAGAISVPQLFPPELSGLDEKKIKLNYFFEKAREEENKKSDAELRRLLYVAMTRAEREIYLLGKLKAEAADALFSNEEISKENLPEQNPVNFFGLLLPVFAERKNETINGKNLFEIEAIPKTAPDEIRNGLFAEHELKLNREDRALFISKARKLYDGAEIRQAEKVFNCHKSVTSLKALFKPINAVEPAQIHDNKEPQLSEALFNKADAILNKYNGAGIFADFGSLVHACIEALLKNKSVEIPDFIEGKFNQEDAAALLEISKQIAGRFTDSEFAQNIKSAKWVKSEFPFRLITDNSDKNKARVFINGTIDIVFEKDDSIYIVDFKTDKTKIINEHLFQLKLYHNAALGLWRKNTRVFLYYLRKEDLVELTKEVSAMTLNL